MPLLSHHQMLPSQSLLQKRHRLLQLFLINGNRIHPVRHLGTILRAVIISHVYRAASAAACRHITVQHIGLDRKPIILKHLERFLILFRIVCAVYRFSLQKLKHPNLPSVPHLTYINNTRIFAKYACAQSNSRNTSKRISFPQTPQIQYRHEKRSFCTGKCSRSPLQQLRL